MKILHVYKTYYPDSYGGIEQAIRHLANGGKAHGIKSEVFTLSANPKGKRFKYEDHFVSQAKTNIEIASTPLSFSAISKFRDLAPKFDLIHYHYPYPFADIMKLSSGIDKPSIVTYHSDIVRQQVLKHAYAPIQRLFLNSVDRIICTSSVYLKTSLVLQKHKDKTEAVSLGLDSKTFHKASQKDLKKWKAEIDQPFFLFLGVLRNYKGVSTLLEAAKNLSANVVIAGAGPELEKLRTKARAMKLKNVYFTGKFEDTDKAALLELCSGLVLPSHLRSEAFGLVQLEAAMRRKPLICTELGTGTSYVNEHENTGLVIPPKNSQALHNAMNFLIFHPTIAEQMGRQAERRFEELFSAKKMCAEYARIYDEVLQAHKSKPSSAK